MPGTVLWVFWEQMSKSQPLLSGGLHSAAEEGRQMSQGTSGVASASKAQWMAAAVVSGKSAGEGGCAQRDMNSSGRVEQRGGGPPPPPVWRAAWARWLLEKDRFGFLGAEWIRNVKIGG